MTSTRTISLFPRQSTAASPLRSLHRRVLSGMLRVSFFVFMAWPLLLALPAAASSTGSNWRGAWAGSNSYAVNDLVSYNGGMYLNTVATAPVTVTTTAGGGNLFDKSAAAQDVVIVAGTGVAAGIGGFYSTGFVNVTGASSFVTNITPNVFDPYGVAFYDANRAYVSGSLLRGNGAFPPGVPIPVPGNAHYVRFWWQNGVMGTTLDAAVIDAGTTLQSTYTPFGGGGASVTTTTTTPSATPTDTTHWSVVPATPATTTPAPAPTIGGPYAGKKMFVLADSIIWQNPAVAVQIASVVGATLSSQGFTGPGVDAVPGRTFNNFDNGQSTPISAAVLADVDVLLIALGTNQVSSAGIGSPSDTASFSGSMSSQMRYMLETIMSWKPGMRIIVVGPYQTNRYNVLAGADGLLGTQDAGKTMANAGSIAVLRNINNGMKAVTNLYGIPYIDMFNESGVNFTTSALWLSDGLHPNAAGYSNFYIPYIAAQLPRFVP